MTSTADIGGALAVAVAARIPVALAGPPGIGKTTMVEQLGASRGAHVEIIVLAQSEPTDLTGIPYVTADGRSTTATPDWVYRVNSAVESIVFLDEFTQASALHQGVSNDIVQSRRVGNTPLGDHVRFVAGYNPPELCGGFDLSLPTRNRFIHLDVEADPEYFADGITMGWPDLPRYEASDFGRHHAAWRCVVGAFVRARPSVLAQEPNLSETGGFPTPRSLEMAAAVAAYADAADASTAVRNCLIAGAIGRVAAVELIAYASELDLPDPRDVLKDPMAVPIPDRPDRAMAMMQAVAQAAIAIGDCRSWEAAWAVAERLANASGPDLAAAAAQTLARHRPDGAAFPRELDAFTDLLGQ